MQNSSDAFGCISSMFGLFGINFVRGNIKQFKNQLKEKNSWLLYHIRGMIGGYIATVSAFSAVNFNFLPTIIQWLWSSIIGVPLRAAWINFYKRKFKSGKKMKNQ